MKAPGAQPSNSWAWWIIGLAAFIGLITLCFGNFDSTPTSTRLSPTPNPTIEYMLNPTVEQRRESVLNTFSSRDILTKATQKALFYRLEAGDYFDFDFIQKIVHGMEIDLGWSGDSFQDPYPHEWNITPGYVASACSLMLGNFSTMQGLDDTLRVLDFKGVSTLGAIVGGLEHDAYSIEVYCLDQIRKLQAN